MQTLAQRIARYELQLAAEREEDALPHSVVVNPGRSLHGNRGSSANGGGQRPGKDVGNSMEDINQLLGKMNAVDNMMMDDDPLQDEI